MLWYVWRVERIVHRGRAIRRTWQQTLIRAYLDPLMSFVDFEEETGVVSRPVFKRVAAVASSLRKFDRLLSSSSVLGVLGFLGRASLQTVVCTIVDARGCDRWDATSPLSCGTCRGTGLSTFAPRQMRSW